MAAHHRALDRGCRGSRTLQPRDQSLTNEDIFSTQSLASALRISPSSTRVNQCARANCSTLNEGIAAHHRALDRGHQAHAHSSPADQSLINEDIFSTQSLASALRIGPSSTRLYQCARANCSTLNEGIAAHHRALDRGHRGSRPLQPRDQSLHRSDKRRYFQHAVAGVCSSDRSNQHARVNMGDESWWFLSFISTIHLILFPLFIRG